MFTLEYSERAYAAACSNGKPVSRKVEKWDGYVAIKIDGSVKIYDLSELGLKRGTGLHSTRNIEKH
jgi:hypothetical protein